MCVLHNHGNTLVFTGSEMMKNWPRYQTNHAVFPCFRNSVRPQKRTQFVKEGQTDTQMGGIAPLKL